MVRAMRRRLPPAGATTFTFTLDTMLVATIKVWQFDVRSNCESCGTQKVNVEGVAPARHELEAIMRWKTKRGRCGTRKARARSMQTVNQSTKLELGARCPGLKDTDICSVWEVYTRDGSKRVHDDFSTTGPHHFVSSLSKPPRRATPSKFRFEKRNRRPKENACMHARGDEGM
jgi:hypothetical protein